MIHLTQKEKADRYDAIQSAIKFMIEVYSHRCEEAKKKYWEDEKPGTIAAYRKGTIDTYSAVITDIERWNDG